MVLASSNGLHLCMSVTVVFKSFHMLVNYQLINDKDV